MEIGKTKVCNYNSSLHYTEADDIINRLKIIKRESRNLEDQTKKSLDEVEEEAMLFISWVNREENLILRSKSCGLPWRIWNKL